MIALVPNDEGDPYDTIGRLIAPYSESVEVSPYTVGCWCVGRVAMREAIATADARYGPYGERELRISDAIRNTIGDPPDHPQDPDDFMRWMEESRANPDHPQYQWVERVNALRKELNAPYQRYLDEVEHSHPLYKQPDAECLDCHGSGLRETTSNPQGYYDYWGIGGRWDGAMIEVIREYPAGGVDFGVDGLWLTANTCVAKVYVEWLRSGKHSAPSVIVTPGGEWLEIGRHGWWGSRNDMMSQQQWNERFCEVLDQYPDHFAIACDCHA